MRKFHSFIFILSIIMLIIFNTDLNVYAASYGVSASNNGDGSVTVTVSGPVVGGFNIEVGGQSTSVYINDIGGSASATIKTGAGNYSVKVSSISISDAQYNVLNNETVTTNVNVTEPQSDSNPSPGNDTNENSKPQAQKPEEKKQEEKKLSSNANLASLSISQGTLSPKFSASKTQYTVNLNGDVSSIKVNATTADSKAVVYGTGTKSLKPGKNTISVSVAAEDGSTKEYTITVNVDETPLVYVSYNGAKLGFVRSLDGVDKPAKSFEAVKIKVDGKEVKAWKSNLLKKTVVYLQDDKTKEKNYYIYNTDTNTVETMLRPMALLGNNVFVVDVPKNLQTREGMNFTTVKIDNYELNGWTFKDTAFENYALIYVMDEKGNMVYYQYEATEKTLQLYSGAATIPQSAYDQYRKDVDASLKKHKLVIYGLAGGCVVLAGLSAFLFFRRKKTVKYQKRTISDSRRDAEADALRNISDDN